MALGEEGYHQHTRDILAVTQEIAAGVREIKGLRLLGGTPQAMIVCFAGALYWSNHMVCDAVTKGFSRGSFVYSLRTGYCVICCSSK
jgi:glutamate/tyrosine decarboxylase-like PLP-dependent enzyme